MPTLTSLQLLCLSTTRSKLLRQPSHERQPTATARPCRSTPKPLRVHSHVHRPLSPTSPTSSPLLTQARSHSCLAPCLSRTMFPRTLNPRLASTPILHASSPKCPAPARPPASALLPNHNSHNSANPSIQHSPPCLEVNLNLLLYLFSHQHNNLGVLLI